MLDRLLANWPLKLLALGLAFAIWVSVTGEKRVVQDFSLPLEIELSPERVLASPTPHTVTVRLRGVESVMRRLDPVPMTLQVDLRETAPGGHEVQLTNEDLSNVPRGVDVEFIDPDRLSLVVERRLRSELDVEVAFLGQPPDGYHFYGAEIVPAKIVVEGPESQVEPLAEVRTNPIRLDQRTEPFVARVGAVPEGQFVRVVDPRPLEVRVDVDAEPEDRIFRGIPVVVIGGGEGSRATPDQLDVTISGPPHLVDRILPDQIRLVADVSDLEPSSRGQAVDVRVEVVDVPARSAARIADKAPSQRQVSVVVTGDNRS
jgi:YbbR domain-containing protein